MWELSVGVQRPKLQYPSSLGALQRMPGLSWKSKLDIGTEGESLCCVGGLTCAFGVPVNRDAIYILKSEPCLQLLVNLWSHGFFGGRSLENTVSAAARGRTSHLLHYGKFANEICIVFSEWMREYDDCDLVSLGIACPTVFNMPPVYAALKAHSFHIDNSVHFLLEN